MMGLITWLAVLAIVAALGVLGAIVARAYINGTSPAAVFFKPRPEPRIEVIEQSNLDGKRRLVLIRRDEVEHLIMTGGPVDVVIETGIGERPVRSVELPAAKSAATVFTRAPRGFGQSAAAEADRLPETPRLPEATR